VCVCVCVWIGALVSQSVWYLVCGSKVWRVSEVNKQPYCQSMSRCLLSSLLSSFSNIPLSFLNFFLFSPHSLSPLGVSFHSEWWETGIFLVYMRLTLTWRVKETKTCLSICVRVCVCHTHAYQISEWQYRPWGDWAR